MNAPRFGLAVLALLALVPAATANDAVSPNYRLVGGTPASIAATTGSPTYQAQIAGGSGTPVGMSASPNTSVVVGPTSAALPTDGVFRDGLEG
jgi:tetrahydromethanopterin S-methyltransferase subunit D